MVNWLHYNSVPTEVHPENTTWQDLNLQNIYKDSSLLHKELLMHVVWFVKSELIHGVLRIHLSDNVRHSYFSYSVVSDYLRPHGLQHARLPCPSLTPGTYSNSCPSRQWCHATISSSVVPFFSHLLSFPASGSFPMSWFFASGGQSIGVSASASVLPMNTQNWFPLGCTGWISLQSKGLSRVFSNTTVPKAPILPESWEVSTRDAPLDVRQ